MGLDDPVGVSWQLFHDKDSQYAWKWHEIPFRFANFLSDTDGYTLYVEVVWPILKNKGDVFGITLTLPNGSGSDNTGFYWMFDRSSNSYS